MTPCVGGCGTRLPIVTACGPCADRMDRDEQDERAHGPNRHDALVAQHGTRDNGPVR